MRYQNFKTVQIFPSHQNQEGRLEKFKPSFLDLIYFSVIFSRFSFPASLVKGRVAGVEILRVQIERKKIELDGRRPLTEGEVARLNEDFMIEYTYNSNAIEGNTLTLRETDMVLKGLHLMRCMQK